MAIYHHSVSVIKRSSGKSVIAAAAYRSGEKIADLRTGLTHDYTRKTGVSYSEIIAPVMLDRSWLTDRFQLWNQVEASEKRHDSQLAREINIAIPVELDRPTQIALVREYVKTNYVERGMVADLNFHDLESNNPHVHIMLTMRDLLITDGRAEFGNKNRDWNSKDLLLEQRQSWETLANQYLTQAGYVNVSIDCRSLEAQGIERIPQIHLGADVNAMRSKGIPTDRGDRYDQIETLNQDLQRRIQQIALLEAERIKHQQIEQLERLLDEQIAELEQKQIQAQTASDDNVKQLQNIAFEYCNQIFALQLATERQCVEIWRQTSPEDPQPSTIRPNKEQYYQDLYYERCATEMRKVKDMVAQIATARKAAEQLNKSQPTEPDNNNVQVQSQPTEADTNERTPPSVKPDIQPKPTINPQPTNRTNNRHQQRGR